MHVHEEENYTVERLINLSSHPKVISLGETGLDYHYSTEHTNLQIKYFAQHIEAAQATGLPLVIHARDADKEIAAMLESHLKAKVFSGVIHCFSASNWLAHACLEMGFYISAAGIITFKNAEDIRATFKQVPLKRLLVETDAPYLAPTPHRGKKNEPAFVCNVLECLADVHETTLEAMAQQTTDNFHSLFKKLSY
jgi:TatD DNase family protein